MTHYEVVPVNNIKEMKNLMIIILLLFLFSCKNNEKKTEAEKIVAEWIGKEIQFPDNFQLDYPVFIDDNNVINHLNHLPKQMEYQCFLLDKDNKVLLIGNPVLNPKIWELYKQTLTGTAE